MLRRRGLLGGLVAALASPAIVRTPGLLMPLSVLPVPDAGQLFPEYREEYAAAVNKWRGMWAGDPGEMAGFAPGRPVGGADVTARSVSDAMLTLARMRELEAQIAERLGNPQVAAMVRADYHRDNAEMWAGPSIYSEWGPHNPLMAKDNGSAPRWVGHWRNLKERGIT